MEGVLGPSASGRFIMEKTKLIEVDPLGVQRVARMIVDSLGDGTFSQVEFAAHTLHPKQGGRDAVDWVFFADTINFSFWPDEGYKYDVSIDGQTHTGYFAACAAINKAINTNIPITSAEWMANASLLDVDDIFRSDSGYSIPLLEERVKAINDSGKVLLEKFGGSFYNCVVAAEGSAQRLLSIIVENFESFRDFAVLDNTKVSFLKRAQILVADVAGALKDIDTLGDFHDIQTLTMFADYRVPQALAYLGALKYSDDLLNKLGEGKRLEHGCDAEIALRGASIHVCDLIVDACAKLAATEGVRKVCAAEVDVFIWVYRRQHAKDIEQKKGIRKKLLECYPHIEPYLEEILPKKENFKLIKCKDHVELLADHNGVVQFLKTRNTEFVPTLRLLHKYPFLLPLQQVDKGAIRFVLNGSSIMCPGLTSEKAKLTLDVPKDAIVAVMAEDKQHALAIGQMKMSSEEIQTVNKGIGIENLHYLTDGLWRLAEKPMN